MTYMEHLERKIDHCLEHHEPIPMDLFFEAVGEGMDVDSIERTFNEQIREQDFNEQE